MTTHLVWFRNDLRLHDHAPLTDAIAQAKRDGGSVLPALVIDPVWFGKTRFGFDRIGSHRRKFLLQAIEDLDSQLQSIGGRLLICRGGTADALGHLVDAIGDVATLRFHGEYPPEEAAIERQVVSAMQIRGVDVEIAPPTTLYAAEDLPFELSDTPDLYTHFRKIVEANCEPRPPIEAPEQMPAIFDQRWQRANHHPLETIELLEPPCVQRHQVAEVAIQGVLEFRGGETAGLARLDHYLWKTDSLRTYKETRNGMLGADYSSKFSPWLAMGCLSARRIAAEVRQYEADRVANQSTYWMIFELLWRDYFAFIVAKHGRDVFRVGGLRRQTYPWKNDPERFDAWRLGQTGYPLIDANLRELAATGFMSNRGRQNVGSFLTKNLGLDWRLGAEHFESLLIDYDPSSNWGNWNYVAGVGNDARGFRWFNTTKQAKQYDPEGHYVRHWCPELVDVPTAMVHEPWTMSVDQQRSANCEIGTDYPCPIVDLFASADENQAIYRKLT